MKCNCGGIFFVTHVYENKDITKDRLCDVQCGECGKVHYSQPYDSGQTLNLVESNKKTEEKNKGNL